MSLDELASKNTAAALNEFWASEGVRAGYYNDRRLAHFTGVIDEIAAYIHDDMQIVDVGCGPAYFFAALKERFPDKKLNATGVDFALSALHWAQSVADWAFYHCQDITRLKLPPQRYDLTTCIQTLEHIEHFEDVLEALCEITKPQGHIIVTVPDGAIDRWTGHVNFWTLEDMTTLAAQYGTVVNCKYIVSDQQRILVDFQPKPQM